MIIVCIVLNMNEYVHKKENLNRKNKEKKITQRTQKLFADINGCRKGSRLILRNRHACFVLPCLINMVAITKRSFSVNEVQNGGKQKKVADVGDDSSANRRSPSSTSRTSLAPKMSPKVGFMTGNGFRAGVTGSPAVHFSSRTFQKFIALQ